MPEDIGVVLDGFYHHVCNGRLAKVEPTTAAFIQQSIHGGKCPSGVERVRRESSVGRQTVVQAPREENGSFCVIDVRKSPPIERHSRVVPPALRSSQERTADRGVCCGPGGPPHQAPKSTSLHLRKWPVAGASPCLEFRPASNRHADGMELAGSAGTGLEAEYVLAVNLGRHGLDGFLQGILP